MGTNSNVCRSCRGKPGRRSLFALNLPPPSLLVSEGFTKLQYLFSHTFCKWFKLDFYCKQMKKLILNNSSNKNRHYFLSLCLQTMQIVFLLRGRIYIDLLTYSTLIGILDYFSQMVLVFSHLFLTGSLFFSSHIYL